MKRTRSVLPCILLSWGCLAQANDDYLTTAPIKALLGSVVQPSADAMRAGPLALKGKELESLRSPQSSAAFNLSGVDELTGNENTPLTFSRMRLWAPQAQIRILEGTTRRIVSPPQSNFFRASNASTTMIIAVDPVSGEVFGLARKNGSVSVLSGNLTTQVEFKAVEGPDDSQLFCGSTRERQPADSLDRFQRNLSSLNADAPAGVGINYDAVIAVDTDNEWLAGKGGNTTTATNFITNLFVAMNVYYERDLQTHLLLGDITLRTGSGDPYASSGDVFDHLEEFGEEWFQNNGAIDRDFAIMLSGRGVSSNVFSGVAWLDQYCDQGHLSTVNGVPNVRVGSYANNRIGSNLGTGFVANLVGHEIGHLLGSDHTHCYNPPVDTCFNGEAAFGCYAGAVSWPGGLGTTMSYCHFGPPNGAACGTSDEEFHPTVQTLIEGRIAANSPSCIAPHAGSEIPLFEHGFENP